METIAIVTAVILAIATMTTWRNRRRREVLTLEDEAVVAAWERDRQEADTDTTVIQGIVMDAPPRAARHKVPSAHVTLDEAWQDAEDWWQIMFGHSLEGVRSGRKALRA